MVDSVLRQLRAAGINGLLAYRLLPVSNLYMIRITAITIKIWIRLPKSGKAKKPMSHPMINNTIISHTRSLIIDKFVQHRLLVELFSLRFPVADFVNPATEVPDLCILSVKCTKAFSAEFPL